MKNLVRSSVVSLTTSSLCSALLISPVLLASPVAAQPLLDEPTSVEDPAFFTASPAAPADPTADATAIPSPTPSVETRDTSNCPFRLTPPPAVDTSEVPAPGETSPAPLPVPERPAGGPRMAECDLVAPAGFTAPEHITASSWAIIDTTSGDVIAAKDPHGRYRPASVIKVLLALVALEELPLDQKITATYEDAAIEGSRAGVVEGNEYTVKLLLQGLLMNSGNDAGHALIRALGGPEVALAKVNDKARALGATDTRVGNPTGLDSPGQMTSAFDLGLFYAAAFNDATFRDLAATRLVTMPGNEELELPDFQMSNDNQLLTSGYEGALGGKTGFTDDARHTFVGVAERDGRRLAAVVLDATVVEQRPWQQAAALLDAGFSTAPGTAVGDLHDLPQKDSGDDGRERNPWQRLFGDNNAADNNAGGNNAGGGENRGTQMSPQAQATEAWAVSEVANSVKSDGGVTLRALVVAIVVAAVAGIAFVVRASRR